KRISLNASIIISITIIFLLLFGIYKAIAKIDFKYFLSIAGDELQTDAFNHTNFLILGTGGANHEGGDLTDTIIVASMDNQDKLVTMMSIPRDLWIKDSLIGNFKINEFYYYAKEHYGSNTKGIEHTKEKIEEVVGIPIHYYVQIDFKGFTELVDAMGGIDVYVQEAIYDPYYPKDGTIFYETFSIPAGDQHLDGETALKYARSRKTTSDFDRARRQQQIIYATKERALQTEIIFSKDKITELLNTLKNNIETNVTVKEILTLGSMAADYSEENITQRFIHDDQYSCGGFLYTPIREAFGGLFVLLPAGGIEYVHQYANYTFNYPKSSHKITSIHLLNGTKTNYVATETKQVLRRFCFEIPGFGNASTQDIEYTTYYYLPKHDENGTVIQERPVALDYLQTIIPGRESTTPPQEYMSEGYFTDAEIVLEMGRDYIESPNYIEDPFYNLEYQLWTPGSDEEDDDDDEEESDEDEEGESDDNENGETSDEGAADESIPTEEVPVVPEPPPAPTPEETPPAADPPPDS
ncbi:LCP family protein, partial [Patescibacteria group bacterium]